MAWEVCYISGLNTGTISNINEALAISGWQNNVPWENYMSDLGDNIADGVTQNTETDIWSNNEWHMTLRWANNGNVAIKVYKNNVIFAELCSNGNLKAPCYIGFLINEDTQEGFCLTCALQYSRGYPAEASSGINNLIYQFLKQNPIISYQWQSVQSISGKNKTVSLTTLKEESINDGSPVDDATASAFNNDPNSCSVGGIISAILPIIEGDPTSVAIKYNIPPLTDSTYTSVKLVAKKKKIPKSKTDGDRIIDISPSSGSATVSSLDELTKYYFVIFVEDSVGNKAESEPAGPITTGEIPAPFRETVEVLKKTGDDEFTSVYEWTGKWGKPDDASTTHFTVEAQEILDITESATETHFTVEHNETNFISENTETEIVLT